MSNTNVVCENKDCRYLTKDKTCGLIEINIDPSGLCRNQETYPDADTLMAIG